MLQLGKVKELQTTKWEEHTTGCKKVETTKPNTQASKASSCFICVQNRQETENGVGKNVVKNNAKRSAQFDWVWNEERLQHQKDTTLWEAGYMVN